MYLEFLEKATPQVLLVRKLLHERALLIDSLKVFDHGDLLSVVHFLVEFEELVDDFLEHGLLGGVRALRDE